MKLLRFPTNNKGQSLIIIIFLLPLLLGAVFTTMQNWNLFSQKERLLQLNAQLKNIVDYFHLNLNDINYWAQTVNHANNAGATKMDCIKNSTSCATLTSFTLLDTIVTDQGALSFNTATRGFNMWDLTPCEAFNEADGSGSAECIFRPRIYWRAICNDAGCERPNIQLRIDVDYNSRAPNPRALNTKKYNTLMTIGSGTSMNQIIQITRRYTYSDAGNYSYAAGSPPMGLNLAVSPSQASRMEGPCATDESVPQRWTPRALDDPLVPDDGLIVNEGGNVLSINPSTPPGQSFTLRAGTYFCSISAPAYDVGSHRIRLASVTPANSVLIYGIPTVAGLGTNNRATLKGLFTIEVDTILEVQHFCDVPNGPFGLGRPFSLPTGDFDTTFTTISCSRTQ